MKIPVYSGNIRTLSVIGHHHTMSNSVFFLVFIKTRIEQFWVKRDINSCPKSTLKPVGDHFFVFMTPFGTAVSECRKVEFYCFLLSKTVGQTKGRGVSSF